MNCPHPQPFSPGRREPELLFPLPRERARVRADFWHSYLNSATPLPQCCDQIVHHDVVRQRQATEHKRLPRPKALFSSNSLSIPHPPYHTLCCTSSATRLRRRNWACMSSLVQVRAKVLKPQRIRGLGISNSKAVKQASSLWHWLAFPPVAPLKKSLKLPNNETWLPL